MRVNLLHTPAAKSSPMWRHTRHFSLLVCYLYRLKCWFTCVLIRCVANISLHLISQRACSMTCTVTSGTSPYELVSRRDGERDDCVLVVFNIASSIRSPVLVPLVAVVPFAGTRNVEDSPWPFSRSACLFLFFFLEFSINHCVSLYKDSCMSNKSPQATIGLGRSWRLMSADRALYTWSGRCSLRSHRGDSTQKGTVMKSAKAGRAAAANMYFQLRSRSNLHTMRLAANPKRMPV
jgi:hypothetical protein